MYREYTEAFYKMIASNPAGRVVQDIWVSAKIIVSCIPLSFLYCVVYVYAVSKFAHAIAWFVIVAVGLALWITTGVMFYEFGKND